MISQMQQSIKSCVHCLQHEGNLPKTPLHPIVATTSLDLLHIDFTRIEMTMELNQTPRVTNVPGVPGPLHEACYGICDLQSNS